MSPRRVLVVCDWTVDPHAVVAALSCRAERERCEFALLVPAWLHGLDWAGDPNASVPCATRQLERIVALAAAAGLKVVDAQVGDPSPVAAVCDALLSRAVDELLICARGHHRLLRRRVSRAAEVPVGALALPQTHAAERARLRRGHCDTAVPDRDFRRQPEIPT